MENYGMSIEYLCKHCVGVFNLKGFDAVNEVGRKYCAGCGNNDDDLLVVSEGEYNTALQEALCQNIL